MTVGSSIAFHTVANIADISNEQQSIAVVCISEKCQECRRISDVKKVWHQGDYYEVAFRLSKYSYKFICQKDLPAKGTLREFEALFEGKVVSVKE